MKKISSIALLLLIAISMSGCGEKTNDYGVDLESPNVLSCTNLNYNYLTGKDAKILENHLYVVEYADNKTDILNVKEIYTADISKTEEANDNEAVEEFKTHIKSRFCDSRKSYITPRDYSGKEATCDVTYKDNVITAVLTYPKEIVDYAVEKEKFGSFDEVKSQLENGEFSAAKNTYFTCDKDYDKSTFVTKELSAILNVKFNKKKDSLDPTFYIGMLRNEIVLYNRFREEILKEYKVDTSNRVDFVPNKEEYNAYIKKWAGGRSRLRHF